MWNWQEDADDKPVQQIDDLFGDGDSSTEQQQQDDNHDDERVQRVDDLLRGSDSEQDEHDEHESSDASNNDDNAHEEDIPATTTTGTSGLFSFQQEQKDQATPHDEHDDDLINSFSGRDDEQDAHGNHEGNGKHPSKHASLPSGGIFSLFGGGSHHNDTALVVPNGTESGRVEEHDSNSAPAHAPSLAEEEPRPSLFGFFMGEQKQQPPAPAPTDDNMADEQNENDDSQDSGDELPMAEIEFPSSAIPAPSQSDEDDNHNDDHHEPPVQSHYDFHQNNTHDNDPDVTSTATDDELIKPKAKPKQFVIPNALPPPVSKNMRKCGLLVVGIGGASGTMLLAGQLANQHKLSWETSTGGVATTPNWKGCITQIPPRGVDGGGGYGGVYDLASATVMAISGWDINSTPLGDALYKAGVVEYDLVRQVRDAMNQISFWPGIYNPSFISSLTNHNGNANHHDSRDDKNTHVLPYDRMSFLELIQAIRHNIRTFKAERKVNGHTTVVWAATTERPAQCEFLSGEELVDVFSQDLAKELDVAPSLLYAMAAAMEGCSFVMGSSHTTMAHPYSDALSELFMSRSQLPFDRFSMWSDPAPVSMERSYVVGTGFSVGHSQLPTAMVEYVRLLGLSPRVMAGSSCSGSGDQRQQAAMASERQSTPAQRQPRTANKDDNVAPLPQEPFNVYAAWHETELDHHNEAHFKSFLGDQHTQTVTTTSLGFLDRQHSMTVHSQCFVGAMTVPCIVDSAVWLDYFVYFNVPSYKVAQATAYLFNIPEGGAKGLDPGFARQMEELEHVLCGIAPKNKSPGWARTDRPGTDTASAEKEAATRLANELFQKGVSANIINNEQATKLRELVNVLLLYYDY